MPPRGRLRRPSWSKHCAKRDKPVCDALRAIVFHRDDVFVGTAEAALRTAEARATELESALRSAKFDAGQAEGKLQKSKALVADLKKELKAIEGKLQTASQRAESAAQRSRTFAIFLFLAILVAGGSLALPYLLTQH